MFPVTTTQQTLPLEVSIPQSTFCYPKSNYQLVSTGSLLMQCSPTPPPRSDSSMKVTTLLLLLSLLNTLSEAILPEVNLHSPLSSLYIDRAIPSTPTQSSLQFSSTLSVQSSAISVSTHRYPSNLTPIPSNLHPHCTAWDHLCLWKPTFICSSGDPNLDITDEDLDCLIIVINSSWQSATWETYGAGILVFHVFCDLKSIPEDQQCPADLLLMLTFVSSCAGAYSGKTLKWMH